MGKVYLKALVWYNPGAKVVFFSHIHKFLKEYLRNTEYFSTFAAQKHEFAGHDSKEFDTYDEIDKNTWKK